MMPDHGFFLIEDLPALQGKIQDLGPLWRGRWQRFCDRAQAPFSWEQVFYGAHPVWPLHAPLAGLVDSSAGHLDLAAAAMAAFPGHYPRLLQIGNQDHDPWIHAAAMARLAIATSWLGDAGALDRSLLTRLGELFLRDATGFALPALLRRVPPHSNNQGMALALHLMVVGHLWGHRHGADPRARHLWAEGCRFFEDQIALAPPGGYGGEGSTYAVLVADPLLALGCAVYEAGGGPPLFDRPLGPHGNTVRAMLTLNEFLPGPSHIYPGWDQHGFMRQTAGTPACYAAWRSRQPLNPAWLDHAWEWSGRMAWLEDDHVWQWIWMPPPPPQTSPASPTPTPSRWAFDHVAGALGSPDRRLFQMWDVSAPRPVRFHMNPNSILVEAWDSLLLVDGNAAEDAPMNRDPEMQYEHQYADPPRRLSWAAGALASHSVLLMDGCGTTRVPRSHRTDPVAGRLLGQGASGNLQWLAADVAAFYHAQAPVDRCTRVTALVGGTFWIILDAIEAPQAHAWTWQAMLRPEVENPGTHLRVRTAEAVCLDLIALDGAPWTMETVPGYPSTLERRCVRARRHLRGTRLEFLTVLAPAQARIPILDLTPHLQTRADEADAGLADGWQAHWPGGSALDPAEWSFWTASHPRCWFHAEFPWPEGGDLLELPAAAGLRVWLDGTELTIPPLHGFHHPEPRLQAPFLPLPRPPRVGQPVRLTARAEGHVPYPLAGAFRIHRAHDPAPARATWREGRLEVVLQEGHFQVDLGPLRAAARLPLPPAPPRLEPPDGPPPSVPREAIPDDPRATATTGDWPDACLALRFLGHRTEPGDLDTIRTVLLRELDHPEDTTPGGPRWRIKEACLLALEASGDRTAAPAVRRCLHPAQFYGVRRLAARALGRLGGPEDASLLQTTSRCDPDPEAAEAAAAALRRLGLAAG